MKRTRRLTGRRINTDPQNSKLKGFAGIYETALRRFKTLVFAITLVPMYALASVILASSIFPAVIFFDKITALTQGHELWMLRASQCLGFAIGFFIFGFTLIFVIPLVNFLLGGKPKPTRGTYYSLTFLKWAVHNGLTYIARYTFLEFITPTPFNLLFYRMMGMKIGRGTEINTSAISDPGLITLGSRVTIGGSATLCAHYGQGGFLVIAPVIIKDRVTIGLRAIVFGGVEIGEGSKVLPNSVVLPKTKIPPAEIWGGVPAKRINIKSLSS